MDGAVQLSPTSQPSTKWVHVTGPLVTGATPAPATPTPLLGESDIREPSAKRRREDKERTRVSRACDRCKKKKTRCTGRCPCTLCLKSGLPCEFTASYTRGRVPSVVVDEEAMAANTQSRVSMPVVITVPEASTESAASPVFQLTRPNGTSASNPPPSTNDIFAGDMLKPPDDNEERARSPPRASPDPETVQTDLQGHYVGPASGVSFLLRIQKRLHQNSSVSHNSSIFTFGDAPLPEFDPTFFVLPPKADAQKLVEHYFDFAAPTHRFLHRPSIERLLEEFYDTQGDMRCKEDAPTKTALLLIVFAQASAYLPLGHDNSARYYFACEHQLSKERGAVKLASVQARLVQCFYLLTQSRINHCWSLFGTLAHLAFAIGLNRGRKCDSTATVDYIELESRRRVFWVAYVLDKYLAAALGRPRTFKDEDIDQELPTIVNDSDLHQHSITPTIQTSYEIPLYMAPVEHIKLSRILSHVLRDLYPIRPPTLPFLTSLSQKYTKDLHAWRSNLTRFLDASDLPSSLLIPIYQRQRNVLNLAYYHVMLLVHRPFLLSNFASLTQMNARSSESWQAGAVDVKANVKQCLDAAMGIVGVVDEMNGRQIFRAFWFTQYYAFCAVVVLYIYRIQQGIVEPGKCENYFAAGQRVQAVLSSISESDCLSKRYCLVLEELRLEAAKHQRKPSDIDTSPSVLTSAASPNLLTPNPSTVLSVTTSTPQSDTSPSFADGAYYGGTTNINVPHTPESTVFNTNFLPTSSIMADLTSWGQFDSLVTAGIGMGLLDAGGSQGDGGWGFGLGE